jgi:hypothetical protein
MTKAHLCIHMTMAAAQSHNISYPTAYSSEYSSTWLADARSHSLKIGFQPRSEFPFCTPEEGNLQEVT